MEDLPVKTIQTPEKVNTLSNDWNMVQTDMCLEDIGQIEKQLEETRNKLKTKEKEVSRLLVSEVKNVDKIKDLTQRTWELEENLKKLGVKHEKLGIQHDEKIEVINKCKQQ